MASQAAFLARNPDYQKRKNAEFYARNREREKARAQEWRRQNVEHCKAATKQWREANKERFAEMSRTWFEQNKAYRAEYRRQQYAERRERENELARQYKKANPAKMVALAVKRAAIKRNAIPPWADLAKIEAIYEEARRRSRETGIPHHVDHIYPLQSKVVCGLHCETNLQILTAAENQSKSNRLPQLLENP